MYDNMHTHDSCYYISFWGLIVQTPNSKLQTLNKKSFFDKMCTKVTNCTFVLHTTHNVHKLSCTGV